MSTGAVDDKDKPAETPTEDKSTDNDKPVEASIEDKPVTDDIVDTPVETSTEDNSNNKDKPVETPTEDKPVTDNIVNTTIESKSSQTPLIAGLIVAVAVATFFAGYTAATFMDTDDGISEEQMNMILSEIDSKISALNLPTQEAPPQPVRVSIDDDPIKGNPDAEIVMIEFSDFQCPFCLRFYQQTLPLIEENYIDTGKIKLVYRDFPLQSHENVVPMHIASECADDQGMFWQYHDVLFEQQGQLRPLAGEELITTLVSYADELGLDLTSFERCLTAAVHLEEVQMDYQDGVNYGVRGTPAFFIGNDQDGYVLLSGAQPYSTFENVIESQLG